MMQLLVVLKYFCVCVAHHLSPSERCGPQKLDSTIGSRDVGRGSVW